MKHAHYTYKLRVFSHGHWNNWVETPVVSDRPSRAEKKFRTICPENFNLAPEHRQIVNMGRVPVTIEE